MSAGRDLFIEYAVALQGTRYADMAPLVAAGISDRVLGLAVPALDRIVLDGGLYRPDADGSSAFVMPVRVDYHDGPETDDPDGAISDGAIVDLLAFDPAHPRRWALRLGAAEWLGAVDPQCVGPAAVPVWRTPMGWMLAGCRGLVLLTADPWSQYRLVTHFHSIVAEDDRHASELRQALAHPWPAPPVLVRNTRRAA